MVIILAKYLHKIKHTFCICGCIFFANYASACTLFEPQKPTFVTENSGQLVTLNWNGNNNDIYRLQIVANTPEGGVFWTLDTQIKGQVFTFKLSSNLAVIKVQISNNCDEMTLSNVQSVKPIILVNEKKSCSLTTEDWSPDGLFVKFIPNSNIQNYALSLYEVSTLSADSLKSKWIKKIDLTPPFLSSQDGKVVIDLKGKFNLDLSNPDIKYLVTVIPHCAAGNGLSLAFLLN
jgi:hypothetical protein